MVDGQQSGTTQSGSQAVDTYVFIMLEPVSVKFVPRITSAHDESAALFVKTERWKPLKSVERGGLADGTGYTCAVLYSLGGE